MPDMLAFATHYATWIERANYQRRLLTDLVLNATEEQPECDGTITVTVPAAAWLAARTDARTPMPSEVVDGQ